MKRTSIAWTALALAALVAAGCGRERGGAKAGEESAKNGGSAGHGEGGKGSAGASAEAKNSGPALLAAGDVATVTTTDLMAGVPVSGTLTPGVDIRLTAPVSEVIEAVLVREGQAVRRGQVLARFRMGSIEAMAASAQAQLKIAKSDYERQKNLFAEGAVSQRDVEAAEGAYRVAQANEARATKQWEDASMRAPVSGVISVKSVDAGDRPDVGDPMFHLVNTNELEFEATVPSEFVPQIRPGSAVRLSVTGYPAGAVAGRVARINAAVDAATRQVKIYVNVPNPGGKLVGGLFASGSVVTREARGALAAPAAAIHEEGGATFAMVVKDGKLERREIMAGLRDEAQDRIEILSGLAAGEQVVVGTLEGLTAGRAVQVGGEGR